VNSIIIKLEGITAHAGEPEKGINPAMASIITQFNTFIQADIFKENYLITLFILPWEKAYGVSAGAGEIHLR
jgi:metal-dependent amidase/aminoacylase/carboxypeptidase family protein